MTAFWQKLIPPFTVLAPMDDVTDFVFREIIATQAARPDVFFTEFVSVLGLAYDDKNEVVQKLKYGEGQRPIVAQIWGADPDYFSRAAKQIAELELDGIDINMGCPDRNVMKSKAGAALLHDKTRAEEIICAVQTAAPRIPLSVKTRVFADQKETDEWISFLLHCHLDALTVHARTAKELSKVSARWEIIGRTLELRNEISPNTVIIGNGDVKTYSDVLQKHEQYGVDGVMIGRGIFSNPWVFEKVPRSHSTHEHLELLLAHAKLFEETWGEEKSFHILKKFFKMYVNNFRGADELRKKLMDAESVQQIKSLLDEYMA